VKVAGATGTTLVEAGESWPTITAHAKPAPSQAIDESEITIEETAPEQPAAKAPAQAAPIESASPAIESATPAKPTTSTKAQEEELAQKSFRVASKFEKTDPKRAAELYRAIATDSKTTWSATALIALAQVQLEQLRDPAAALATADEFLKRFPNAATAEEALWVRVQALQALGKRDEARGAAADYLRQFPHGAYADRLTPK
jgi:hypothetical protein